MSAPGSSAASASRPAPAAARARSRRASRRPATSPPRPPPARSRRAPPLVDVVRLLARIEAASPPGIRAGLRDGARTAGGAASGSGHRRVPWCRHGAPSRIEAGTVKGGSRASAPGRARPAGGRASPPRRSAHPRPVNDGRIGNEPHPAHLHRALDPALDAQRPAAAHADPEPFRSLSDGQQSRYFHAPNIAQTLD